MNTKNFNTPQSSRLVATVLSIWISFALFGGLDVAMSASSSSARLLEFAPVSAQQIETVTVTAKRV